MADIELVIKIPEDVRVAISRMGLLRIPDEMQKKVDKAIQHGTPLPKGHGDLIDVNDLLDDICLEDNDYNRDCNIGEIITLEDIDRIPKIIKADKAESEETNENGYPL